MRQPIPKLARPLAPPPGLWRQTPPAIFPPLMGLWGVGLGWRALSHGQGPVAALAEVWLGGVALLAVLATVAWLAKPLRRPGALLDELRPLPGRAGVAAMVLGLMLGAAALTPYAPGIARMLVLVGLAALGGLGILIAWTILTGPPEGRRVTPVMHLIYVGYIIAPLSLVPLGADGAARIILFATMPAAFAIWGLSLRQMLMFNGPPGPLRPLLAIHISPASLFATVAALLDLPQLAMGFALLALALLITLTVTSRWVLAAGFTPIWGALTFPAAACAAAVGAAFGGTGAGLALSAVLMACATALTVFVTLRVFRAWARGTLAAQTNAARV